MSEPEKSVSGKIWDFVKAVAPILSLMTSSVAAVYLGQWYFTYKPRLETVVSANYFALPPDAITPTYENRNMSRFVKLTITNNGEKEAKQLQVTMSNEFFYAIAGSDETHKSTKTKTLHAMADIGGLQAGQSVEVHIWGDDKLNTQKFSVGDETRTYVVPARRGMSAEQISFYVICGIVVIYCSYILRQMLLMLADQTKRSKEYDERHQKEMEDYERTNSKIDDLNKKIDETKRDSAESLLIMQTLKDWVKEKEATT